MSKTLPQDDVFTSTTVTVGLDCPEKGWDAVGYTCFFIPDSLLTRDKASRVCRNNGGFLVEMKSALKKEIVVAYLRPRNAGLVWIGLRGLQNSAGLRWGSSSTSVLDDEFADDFFNDVLKAGKGDCVALDSSKDWTASRVDCAKRYNVLCERSSQSRIDARATVQLTHVSAVGQK